MNSAMSAYIHRIFVVAIATGVMGSPIWGQEIETAVTSFVIGGVTLQEDVKNPPVPSGLQKFVITYNTPITREQEEEKFRYGIAGLQIHSYPFEFAISLYNATQGTGVAVSEDRLTLTGMVDLPAGATYQMLIGRSEAVPIAEQQQYFWGTEELPDAEISGRAILPEGVVPLTMGEGGVALIDPQRYLKALESEQDFDLFQLAIFRITDFNEQLEYRLKHVPDGAYAMLAFQEVVDAEGNRKDVGILRGLNALTGGVDSTALVHVVDGQSITGLQIMLEGEPEPEVIDFSEVRIGSVDAESHSFSVQIPYRRPNMTVDASQALIVNIPKSIQDIVPVFLSGNVDDLLNFVIPFSGLMTGDIISVLGTPISETEMQAILVIRHRKRSDFNGDGNVDYTDFLFFADAFGTRDIFPGYVAEADLDGDGQVAFPDFLIFVSDFGG